MFPVIYLFFLCGTQIKIRTDKPDEAGHTGDVGGPGGEGRGHWGLKLRKRDAAMSPLESLDKAIKTYKVSTQCNQLMCIQKIFEVAVHTPQSLAPSPHIPTK